MMDLRQYTVVEFAKEINENAEVIKDLMRNNDHLGYTNSPFYYTVKAVQESAINEKNCEIVSKYIYTNLFNRPEHRFYR